MKKLFFTFFAMTVLLPVSAFAKAQNLNSDLTINTSQKEVWNVTQGSGGWRGEWIKTAGRVGEVERFEGVMSSTRGYGTISTKIEVERRGDLIVAKQLILSSGTRCYFIGKRVGSTINGTVQMCTETPPLEYAWSAYITSTTK
jgi:hypothetical protein